MPARRVSFKPSTLAACAVSTALFYWWLVAKTDLQQMVAAAVIGLVVSVSLVAFSAKAGLSCALEWSWIGLLLRRLPGKIVRDLGLVLLALWRALAGRSGVTGTYRRIGFKAGGTDPASATRRALVLGSVSLPPNTFAALVEDESTLLVHQLIFESEDGGPRAKDPARRRSPSSDREWPI